MVYVALFLSLVLFSTAGGSLSGTHRSVTLTDNGYTGVVIAIEENIKVNTDQQEEFIQKIKNLMTASSAALYKASLNYAYFKEIKIVVPRDWGVKYDQPTAIGEDFSNSLIRVTENGVYGDVPFTHQSGPCGTPGSVMSLPRTFITDDALAQLYGDSGKVIAQEWLRLRYGVFEEHGFPGDLLYPDNFLNAVTNMTEPTVCSDLEKLEYKWVDQNQEICEPSSTDATCRLMTEDVGTTSEFSLMSATHLTSVEKVCDGSNHIASTPSRQNRLCDKKSIFEVMQLHPDFSDGSSPGMIGNTDPTFTVVKVDSLPLLVLVDKTIELEDDFLANNGAAVYSVLGNNLRTIVENRLVPELGLCIYGDEKETEYFNGQTLIPIDDIDIDAMIDFLPSDPFEEDYAKCFPGYAVEDAAEKLAAEGGNANIFLIQLSNVDRADSEPDLSSNPSAVVSGVIYSSDGNNPWIKEMAEDTGGLYASDNNNSPQTASNIIFSLVADDKTFFMKNEEFSVGSGQETFYDLVVDDSISELYISVTFFDVQNDNEDESQFFIKVETPTYETLYNATDVTEILFGESEVTSGSYRITLINNYGSVMEGYISVSERIGSTAEQLYTTIWTTADHLDSGTLDLEKNNLAIFVSVLQNGYKPVVNLDVQGTLKRGSAVVASSLIFSDDGIGDPDTQLNDGIFSCYVTEFSGSTTQLTVELTIKSSSSVTTNTHYLRQQVPRITPVDPFNPTPCCGSSVPGGVTVSNYERTETSENSITIQNSASYDPAPSRITDFKIVDVDQDGPSTPFDTILVRLRWTETGEDLNIGKASKHDLRYTQNPSDAFADYIEIEEELLEEGTLVTSGAGTQHEVVVQLPKEVEQDTVFYFGITAIDSNDQASPLSPIEMTSVTAGRYITTTEDPTTTTEDPTTTTEDPTTTEEPTTEDPTTEQPTTENPITGESTTESTAAIETTFTPSSVTDSTGLPTNPGSDSTGLPTNPGSDSTSLPTNPGSDSTGLPTNPGSDSTGLPTNPGSDATGLTTNLGSDSTGLTTNPGTGSSDSSSNSVTESSGPATSPGTESSSITPNYSTEPNDSTPSFTSDSSDSTLSSTLDSSDSTPSSTLDSIDSTPSTTIDSDDSTPSTTLDSIDSTPSTTLDSGDSTLSTTLDSDDSTPSTTLDSDDSTPSTTLDSIDSTPSTTLDSIDSTPSTTLDSGDSTASTTLDSGDSTPSTTLDTSDSSTPSTTLDTSDSSTPSSGTDSSDSTSMTGSDAGGSTQTLNTDPSGSTSSSGTDSSSSTPITDTSGPTKPVIPPTEPPGDDPFVGSVGFYVLICFVILIVLGVTVYLVRRYRKNQKQKTQQMQKTLIKPDASVVNEDVSEGSSTFVKKPMPPLDPAKRKPSLGATVMPVIEEDGLSTTSSVSGLRKSNVVQDEVKVESETGNVAKKDKPAEDTYDGGKPTKQPAEKKSSISSKSSEDSDDEVTAL